MLYGKYLRCARQKSAVTLHFILHSPFMYHLEARSHHSSVPLPVLLVSLHWRKLSPHIPITVHCGIQTCHTAWVRCHPANKSQDLPTASCGTGGSIIIPAKGFFPKQERGPSTRPQKCLFRRTQRTGAGEQQERQHQQP
ncbi:hypothetical protein TcCL_Unassigned01695 [Trypanosoma cruzi]|nr:hypothetical protein TcCL_Unassigned01695 [Trypanosoma cruzi]